MASCPHLGRITMIYGYARCSTNESKQDISRQTRELVELGCTADTIYKEYESGAKIDRPELRKLQAAIQEGDTLLSLEVSRITRSTKQLCDIVEFAHERKIKLVLGGIVVDCTSDKPDPFSEAVIKILGVVAELEREMIRTRVKSGLENARAKGKVLGRRRVTVRDIPASFLRYYEQYQQGSITTTELAKLASVSRTTVYKYIKLLKRA